MNWPRIIFINKFTKWMGCYPIIRRKKLNHFVNKKILSVFNLYTFHTTMEAFKILKLQSPKSLYSSYVISQRKQTTVIQKSPYIDFSYRSSVLWNMLSTTLKVNNFSAKIAHTKKLLKNYFSDSNIMKIRMTGM